MKSVIIVLNGELYGKKDDYRRTIKLEESFFIAADGGALLLEKLGLKPDVIIGDLDSLSENEVIGFREKGVRIIEYPVEKDETDGELALEYCLKNKLNQVTILGSQGGRFDQQLANVLLLEYAYRAGISAVIREPGLEIGITGKEKSFYNCKGLTLSLIPLDETVNGVRINGCKYELNNEDLIRFKTRGISNLIVEEKASVSVENGLLLYIVE